MGRLLLLIVRTVIVVILYAAETNRLPRPQGVSQWFMANVEEANNNGKLESDLPRISGSGQS
jgi:hypothetical protein